MTSRLPSALELDLEDVLGGLQYARRAGDLGRLALLTYWEVRRWARIAHEDALALHASEVITQHPHANRTDFLALVDNVIEELEQVRARLH